MKSDNKLLLKKANFVKNIVTLICVCFYLFYILKWAWCSDDAYHAYSMSKNYLNGYGFTPTIGKRVNVSTCPLWTIIITFCMRFFKDEYYTGLVLNLLLSLGSFIIVMLLLSRGGQTITKFLFMN